ncbi:hypothetical protein GCM10010106_01190 [Thermopolyspora flexuosa]|jgi:hypothetical protein|uniref:Uncharacterized protein n=1 Tax=Thermopolyspora flexuosa TaxID=103836 RepID=A0A543IXX0_9ACTN|nr:hypothetical protein [Thermopolyspora flexuosa]TQM75424.1 hypothetical protein FHX40_2130 [Thermopolyspora flexuosa]GGM59195.1 hypothetical protein GCM10010106_01190 [Thermopolyspora flexuosa]
MTVIFAAVGLVAAGLAVLAVLSVRVWLAARELGREVERTRRLLAERRARAADSGPGAGGGNRGPQGNGVPRTRAAAAGGTDERSRNGRERNGREG